MVLLVILWSLIFFSSWNQGFGSIAWAAGEVGGRNTSEETSAESSTEQPSSHMISFHLGHDILFGEWGDLYDDGLGFQLSYTYEATPTYSLQMGLGFAKHDGVRNNTLILRSIEPDLRVNFLRADSLVFYGFGGFGIYPITQKVDSADGSTFNFGMNLGLGLELRVKDRFAFGPGIMMRSVFTKTDRSASSRDYPNGMNIGGEHMMLFLKAGVLF